MLSPIDFSRKALTLTVIMKYHSSLNLIWIPIIILSVYLFVLCVLCTHPLYLWLAQNNNIRDGPEHSTDDPDSDGH